MLLVSNVTDEKGTDLGAALAAPRRYVDWINHHIGFNPRGQKHSDALSAFILDDLRFLCPTLNGLLASGELRVNLNAELRTRVVARNIDLVISRSAAGDSVETAALTIEHKTIMAAHGKARKNRYGDFIAYSNHVHNHSPAAIAAGTLVVNCSPSYENPDEWARKVSRKAGNFAKVVHSTVELFRSIPPRELVGDPGDQPEALCVLLIDYDGRNGATLVTSEMSLADADPLSYGSFCARLARLFEARNAR